MSDAFCYSWIWSVLLHLCSAWALTSHHDFACLSYGSVWWFAGQQWDAEDVSGGGAVQGADHAALSLREHPGLPLTQRSTPVHDRGAPWESRIYQHPSVQDILAVTVASRTVQNGAVIEMHIANSVPIATQLLCCMNCCNISSVSCQLCLACAIEGRAPLPLQLIVVSHARQAYIFYEKFLKTASGNRQSLSCVS